MQRRPEGPRTAAKNRKRRYNVPQRSKRRLRLSASASGQAILDRLDLLDAVKHLQATKGTMAHRLLNPPAGSAYIEWWEALGGR